MYFQHPSYFHFIKKIILKMQLFKGSALPHMRTLGPASSVLRPRPVAPSSLSDPSLRWVVARDNSHLTEVKPIPSATTQESLALTLTHPLTPDPDVYSPEHLILLSRPLLFISSPAPFSFFISSLSCSYSLFIF